MRIGLVGESPGDTSSIKNLLSNKFPDLDYQFLIDRINGSQLDSQKTKRFLRREYEIKEPDIVVFIRDLDSILPNENKLRERKTYFSDFNRVIDKKGIFLLNIYELEALIVADIQTFNRIFNTKADEVDDPMLIEEPKEYLKNITSKYRVSLNPTIFNSIDFDNTLRCLFFKEFIEKLTLQINKSE